MHDKQLPLVSVAIITYNQKEFLRECIESVLEQDYPTFEIIVADDASTDGTQDMLREYYRKYPSKFVLRLAEKNLGITANSNQAHFACKGKYIAWMGGDDLMLPGKLSQQTNHMETHPDCAICYHDLEIFESQSQQKTGLFSYIARPRSGSIKTLLRYGCFIGACSAMIRSSCAPKEGFDLRVPIASDWLYYVRTVQGGGSVHYLPFILGKYRRHAANVTKKHLGQRIEGSSLQDHFISSGILLSEFPEFEREVRTRISDLLYSSREFSESGKRKEYVFSALKMRFNLLNIARCLLFVLRIRR